MQARKAARVFPDPVGASSKPWPPSRRIGQPRRWTSVGPSKDCSNQRRTGALKGRKTDMVGKLSEPGRRCAPAFVRRTLSVRAVCYNSSNGKGGARSAVEESSPHSSATHAGGFILGETTHGRRRHCAMATGGTGRGGTLSGERADGGPVASEHRLGKKRRRHSSTARREPWGKTKKRSDGRDRSGRY